MTDPFNLKRFVEAQEPVFDEVRAQLLAARKTTHWMWFIFPQIEGLGTSPMARRFAIASLDEARAYLQHPVLGARLRECTAIVGGAQGRSIEEILGRPDDMKFRSCMTLFAHASADNGVFVDALRKYFAGGFDPRTLQRLA